MVRDHARHWIMQASGPDVPPEPEMDEPITIAVSALLLTQPRHIHECWHVILRQQIPQKRAKLPPHVVLVGPPIAPVTNPLALAIMQPDQPPGEQVALPPECGAR